MANPKAEPKKKAAPKPKKKVAFEGILEEIKKINERLDKLEGDILALRRIVQPQTAPPEGKEATEEK